MYKISLLTDVHITLINSNFPLCGFFDECEVLKPKRNPYDTVLIYRVSVPCGLSHECQVSHSEKNPFLTCHIDMLSLLNRGYNGEEWSAQGSPDYAFSPVGTLMNSKIYSSTITLITFSSFIEILFCMDPFIIAYMFVLANTHNPLITFPRPFYCVNSKMNSAEALKTSFTYTMFCLCGLSDELRDL